MTLLRSPGEGAVHTHGSLSLHLLFGLPSSPRVMDVGHVLVVVEVAGVSLRPVPGGMLALARSQRHSVAGRFARREAVRGAGLGGMAACPRRLAAGRFHDALDVVVQDALGVLLVSVSLQGAVVADVGVAGAVMLWIHRAGRKPVIGR